MAHFAFLQSQWPGVHEAAVRAEAVANPDPRTACFYARRALELLVAWVYKHDGSLHLPYQENISALIHEPSFKKLAGDAVFNKARIIVRLGNTAVHSPRPIQPFDAQTAVKELFHIAYWLGHTYAQGAKPPAGLTFDPKALPTTAPVPKQTIDQLQKLEAQLRERDEKLSALLADKGALDAELARLRAEIAEAKKANAATPDDHDYSEAETRDYFIDLLLKETGWPLDQERDREYEVDGMPNTKGKGYVDYVLWGDDGMPLGLVEAKRTRRDARVGQQQAKLYADCLEKRFGRRPLIFYSNGYEHWFWDDLNYPPRPVQGFYKKAELELLIQRRTSKKPLGPAEISGTIVERYYQTRAIRRVAEAFEKESERKALLVMATGAGKTRTVIALVDLLMRCNWAKRVLFLADRIALVNQAGNAFKKFLPDAAPVNLVTDKETEGRVFVSTYPTMMGLIDETRDGQRRFGVGHFDLVVIDEAHRSVFQKYQAIFHYFDSFLVGLTATPKGDIDRNTYTLFDLETGVPTDAYPLEEAVKDSFLLPPRSVSVPVKFQRQGIKKYEDLSEEDRHRWDELEWDEEGGIPDEVEAAAVNKWLFNTDTVDKVLEHLMTNGVKVAGGDRLGKTIIFAKNQAHADFIRERFDKHYPKLRGHFAQVITFKTEYAQDLINKFSEKEKPPYIAISVDMLDTGIDVPEVVNLVFFKMVRSKTKFWQMVGRGTRLCPDLFGPGKHKEYFCIFDYCGNLEFFSANPEAAAGTVAESLSKRLFKARLELVGVLDRDPSAEKTKAADPGSTDLRSETAERLRTEVAAMNVDNFVIRPKRKLVETYAKPEAWTALTDQDHQVLAHEVAGLPTELETEPEEAKRFDLLMLNLQLAVLQVEPAFARLRDQVREIAGLLEEKESIPMVREQLSLIQDVQTEEWWQDVTAPMLEATRKRLRLLVQFIERAYRKPIYTDFVDELGIEAAVELPGFGSSGGDFERFRMKARVFLRQHQDHPALRKLRTNVRLSSTDLAELEQLLATSGVGSSEDIEKAKAESHGLGVFVRSLVGLDREAAKRALGGFLAGKTLTANQIEFVNLIVDHLTEHGMLDAAVLYESPFTDITPQGPDGIFTPPQVAELVKILHEVQEAAIAA
jgi:type I restriction enzyme, R subunit